jgi:hypothetical protein
MMLVGGALIGLGVWADVGALLLVALPALSARSHLTRDLMRANLN